MVYLLWPRLRTSHSHMSCSTHLNSGAVTAPTCLSSCKSLRVAGLEPADRQQGWLWLRVLLIPVAMVVSNGEGGIPNTPQEGYGKNLTEDVPSYRDKSPGSPSWASLGSEPCLQCKAHKDCLVLSFSTVLTLCQVFQMCPHCLASISYVP